MTATRSPWKPPFATCHGRTFSRGALGWIGLELGGTFQASRRLVSCSSPLKMGCSATIRVRLRTSHPRFCAHRLTCRSLIFQIWRDLAMLSNPHLAQILADDLQVRGDISGGWRGVGRGRAVCCHCGNGISSNQINLCNQGKHGFNFLFCNSNPCCQFRL